MSTELLGYVAAFLTSMAFLPQAILVIQTKNTSGLSPLMYGAFVSGISLWIAYGVVIQSWPLIAANVVTLIFAMTIFILIIRNKHQS